jgi:hypothetical protein
MHRTVGACTELLGSGNCWGMHRTWHVLFLRVVVACTKLLGSGVKVLAYNCAIYIHGNLIQDQLNICPFNESAIPTHKYFS